MALPDKIRLAARAYDGALPILRGQLRLPGFDLEITETEDVPGMFTGMFKGQYDVSATDSQWYIASMHHWDDADPGATVEPRDGSVIHWIQNEGKNTSERACRALFDGEVDALGITESQLAIMLGNQGVKRLFEN